MTATAVKLNAKQVKSLLKEKPELLQSEAVRKMVRLVYGIKS